MAVRLRHVVTPRTMSPAARTRLRRGYLAGGVGLGLLWLGITIAIGVQGGAAVAGGSQLLLVIFSAPAATLLAIGLLAERSARAFDAADAQFADCLDAALDQLRQLPRAAAYQTDQNLPELRAVGLLGAARPVAAPTVEVVASTLEKQLGDVIAGLTAAYGAQPPPARPDRQLTGPVGAVRGLLDTEFTVSGGTVNWLADATEVTVEPGGSAEPRPARWVILPASGVEGWMRDLLERVAHVLGSGTHASSAVMTARADLVAHFGAMGDGSADQAQPASLPAPTQVLVRGQMLGPGAWLATSVQVDGGERQLIWPSGFPMLLGHALGQAARVADPQQPSDRPGSTGR